MCLSQWGLQAWLKPCRRLWGNLPLLLKLEISLYRTIVLYRTNSQNRSVSNDRSVSLDRSFSKFCLFKVGMKNGTTMMVYNSSNYGSW
jgi:hypothetical protein